MTIAWLDFKTKKELECLPQTVEEHIEELDDSDDDSDDGEGGITSHMDKMDTVSIIEVSVLHAVVYQMPTAATLRFIQIYLCRKFGHRFLGRRWGDDRAACLSCREGRVVLSDIQMMGVSAKAGVQTRDASLLCKTRSNLL